MPRFLQNPEAALRHRDGDRRADTDRRIAITMFTNLNITSDRLSHALSMNVLLGPCTFESATAKMIAKKTICSTSFFAAASKKLVGTVCSMTPVSVVCVAANSAPSFVDAAPRSTPTPGFTMLTASRPTASASVVTISK